MAQKFKLLEGQHVQADRSKPLKDGDGNVIPGRFERKTFKKGDIITTDTDLVAKFGNNKFEAVTSAADDQARIADLQRQLAEAQAKLAEREAPAPPAVSAAAPGGQVSDGFQSTSGSPKGTTSGALDPTDYKRAGVAGAKEETATEKSEPRQLFHGGPQPDFDSMTHAELKSYASDRGIDLHGAKNKEETLARVRTAK